MMTDELALAKISEAFLIRTFARAQSDDRLGIIVQNAVNADRTAMAVARQEGDKIEAVADRFGLEPNGPILAHVDDGTQAYVAPIIIKLADAFAGALIAAHVKPDDLAKIVPQQERSAANGSSFAAHGHTNLAKLFSPT